MPRRLLLLLVCAVPAGCAVPLRVSSGATEVDAIYGVEPRPTRRPDCHPLIRPPEPPPPPPSAADVAEGILGVIVEGTTRELLRCAAKR